MFKKELVHRDFKGEVNLIYTNKINKDFVVSCNCGCQEGLEFRFSKDSECPEHYIELCTSKWYAEQDHGWSHFTWVLKKIWKILRGKDFYYSEICLTESEWKEFKEAVNRVD